MAVIVFNPQRVDVDGANYGAVVDTIANHYKNNPQLASSIQIALNDRWNGLLAEHQAAIAQLQADHQVEMEALQQQIDAQTQAIANGEAAIAQNAALQSQIESLQAELEALKNPPTPDQNWAGLYDDLDDSLLLERIGKDSVAMPAIAIPLTFLISLVTSTKKVENLQRRLDGVKQVLAMVGKPLTTEEITWLNEKLELRGFEARV